MEHVSQAALFLEDAGDLGQALNTDVDEMSMDEQVSLSTGSGAIVSTLRKFILLLVQNPMSSTGSSFAALSTQRGGCILQLCGSCTDEMLLPAASHDTQQRRLSHFSASASTLC